jgi:hypothetical protein
MYCERCGKQQDDAAQFCNACGRALRSPALPAGLAVGAMREGRVQRHLRVVAVLWAVYGALRLLEAGWVFFLGRVFIPPLVSGVTANIPFLPAGFPFERLVASGLVFGAAWAAFFGIVELVLAWGLNERQPWARILAIVIGFLALLRPPFGTALGIYTLWVFLPSSSAPEYDQMALRHG